MDLGLKGKRVIVTGGSKGIGRATALTFAEEGADVAICARGADALEVTRKEIAALGVSTFAQSCDVGDPAALTGFLEAARAALGGVDILINNTSGFGLADDEERLGVPGLQVDLMGSVRATWAVVPWMEEAGGGAIVHISSTSGMEAGSPPAYAAVKAALISHSKTLANQLAPSGIRSQLRGAGLDRVSGRILGTNQGAAIRNTTRACVSTIPFGRYRHRYRGRLRRGFYRLPPGILGGRRQPPGGWGSAQGQSLAS